MPTIGKKVLSYVIEKTYELINVPACNNGIKAVAKAWLDAVGTKDEAAETKKYMDELEVNIMPIDGLVGFTESGVGSQVFGSDKTKNVAAHTKEIKAVGAKSCDCSVCAAVEVTLNKKEGLLK